MQVEAEQARLAAITPAFYYRDSPNLSDVQYWSATQLRIYDGGGYAHDFDAKNITSFDLVTDELVAAAWLDSATRFVVVEVTLFNPPTKLLLTTYFLVRCCCLAGTIAALLLLRRRCSTRRQSCCSRRIPRALLLLPRRAHGCFAVVEVTLFNPPTKLLLTTHFLVRCSSLTVKRSSQTHATVGP